MIPIRPGSKVGHRVDERTGCWEWCGARASNGYGVVGIPGTRRTTQAHRFYFKRERGPIPEGMDLDHLCRNRGCVNPHHLEAVSRFTNAIRGARAKMAPDTVRLLRAKYKAGGVSQTRLGAEFGIDNSVVSDIVNRRTWKYVD